jgi:DNA polymerase-1
MQKEKRCKNKECPLIEKTEVRYSGDLKQEIAVVGESPGNQEVRKGEPFVGRAGMLGRKLAASAGLVWSDMLIMNSARCMIDKKALTTKEITLVLKCCRSNVEAMLHAMKPKCIILLGDYALRQIFRKSGITKTRGRWIWLKEFECWAMPTFHPAYILRNPAEEALLVNDLRLVHEFKENGFEHLEEEEDLDYREVVDLRDVIKEGSYVAIDTESQGLEWMNGNYVMLSASVSDKKGRAYNVNFYEECPVEEADFTIKWKRVVPGMRKKEETEVGVRKCKQFYKKVEGLKWLLENGKIKKTMQHGSHDAHSFREFFSKFDEPLKINGYTMDTQAAAHVVNENLYKMVSLEELQRMLTDYRKDYNRTFELNHNKDDMLAVPLKDRNDYACADADVTRRAALEIRKRLKKDPRLARYYINMVHKTLNGSLLELERRGAFVNREILPETTAEVLELMERESKDAVRLIPRAIREMPIHKKRGLSLSRTDLIRDILFDEDGFRLEPRKKTKGLENSVDKEMRKELLGKRIGKKARSFLEHYDEWRELHTLWSRYLKGFDKWIRSDGRVYSSFSLSTTVTGRVASSKPNMQNNPKRSKSAKIIRKLIQAPKGWLLLAADAEQSELRWAAHVSNSKSMIKIFKAGEDIHTATAKSMIDWEQADGLARKEARQNAKAVNFGILYLMSPAGLVRHSRMNYGVSMTEDEAERYIRIWFQTYPELREYHKRTILFCRNYGYVESPLGRRRRLPEIAVDDIWLQREAERQAVNHPIQSSSSDVVLMSCNEILAEEMLDPNEAFPVLFVHDELVFQIKDDDKVEDRARIVKKAMENPPLERDFGFKMRVPLASEISIGPNLAQLETLSL